MHGNADTNPIAWASERLAACGVDSPRLEAQLLLGLALGTTRTAVIAGTHPPPGYADIARFRGLVEERSRRTPLAYIRGSQEFYGLDFEVGPAVLIPRPETEMLVELAIETITSVKHDLAASTKRRGQWLADVGTGSGSIAVAALAHCPDARAVAVDISVRALQVACRNAARHRATDRLRFVRGNLLGGIASYRFNIILSNPPYITRGEIARLQPEVRGSEPVVALDGGLDGLDVYRRLVPSALRCLVPGGCLAVEIGQRQAPAVVDMFSDSGYQRIEIRRDLAGIERVVAGRT